MVQPHERIESSRLGCITPISNSQSELRCRSGPTVACTLYTMASRGLSYLPRAFHVSSGGAPTAPRSTPINSPAWPPRPDHHPRPQRLWSALCDHTPDLVSELLRPPLQPQVLSLAVHGRPQSITAPNRRGPRGSGRSQAHRYTAREHGRVSSTRGGGRGRGAVRLWRLWRDDFGRRHHPRPS